MHVESRVIEIIKNVIGTNDTISKSSDLLELGISSIDFINIIIKIEEVFKIIIDDTDLILDNFSDINSVVEYVNNKLE